jgi:glycosyltransferase involved in cell wall biosynthesis
MAEVSVVIPTKDRLRYLQRSVSMFLGYDEVKEVIVVVDGCQDGTLDYIKEVCKADRRVRYVDNVSNRGTPYSRNRGIELASYEYIFSAEDDLTLSADFFAIVLSHMHETSADIISGRNIFQTENETADAAIMRTDKLKGNIINKRSITIQTGIKASVDEEQVLLPSPMLARTEVFRDVKFDEAYIVNFWREESDFQLSARERGYKLVFCPHAISFNLEIENDRGGAHSAVGFRKVKYSVRNNWYFVRKHRKLIDEEFDAGNLYIYITTFGLHRLYLEVIRPALAVVKRLMVVHKLNR